MTFSTVSTAGVIRMYLSGTRRRRILEVILSPGTLSGRGCLGWLNAGMGCTILKQVQTRCVPFDTLRLSTTIRKSHMATIRNAHREGRGGYTGRLGYWMSKGLTPALAHLPWRAAPGQVRKCGTRLWRSEDGAFYERSALKAHSSSHSYRKASMTVT
jgi:hypothetical protein